MQTVRTMTRVSAEMEPTPAGWLDLTPGEGSLALFYIISLSRSADRSPSRLPSVSGLGGWLESSHAGTEITGPGTTPAR